MTQPEAADMTVRESPRIDLGALRNLRRLLDATLPSSDARFSIDRGDDDEGAREEVAARPAVAGRSREGFHSLYVADDDIWTKSWPGILFRGKC